MPYVYILVSNKDKCRYIGSTKNLKERIKAHFKGEVPSTKNRRPLVLFGWREFESIYEAVLWEKKYKNSHGQLERDIKNNKIILNKI
mgnify:CR=1 FL=1